MHWKEAVITGKQIKRKLELLPKAREMRADGYSYQDIAATLGIAVGTAFYWTRDTPKGNLFK